MWALWAGWTVASAAADARGAERALDGLRSDLDIRSLIEGDGVAEINTVAERFDEVGARLGSPLLAPMRVAPVFGRQLSAVTHQADAAAVGLRAAAEASDLLDGLVESSARPGPERITALREVAEVARSSRRAYEELDLGPDDALIGPIADARQRIDEARLEALDTLDRAATFSDGLATFFEGPHDYLLLAGNNAQMQNGQGMFLSAGVLHVDGGRLTIDEVRPTTEIPLPPPVPVTLDADLDARWGWLDPNGDFRHVGLSHRFPVSGALAVELWNASGQPPVDGALAVDPFLLQVLLRATGPVAVAADEVTAENAIAFSLHDQYFGGDSVAERRDRVGDLAVQAVKEFDRVDEVAPALLEQMAKAARGRHLLAWSADPGVQAGWEAARINGQITPTSVMLSLINRSGNKVDWYLRTSASVTAAGTDDGYDVVVRVSVKNIAPTSGPPRYVIGPYPGSNLTAGEYQGLVTLNLPDEAMDSHFEGVDDLAVAGADGSNRTIATWVRVKAGTTTEVVARFRLPPTMDALTFEPSARARPTAWTWGSERWDDAEARTLALPSR